MKQKIIIIFSMMFLYSCSTDRPKCSETRDLNIIPSKGIGPYSLGMTEAELVYSLCTGFTKQEEDSWFSKKKTTYYFINNMSFVVRHDKLQEINVWGSFQGSFEGVGLDYDVDRLMVYGDVVVHNEEYRILDLPHIAFGKDNDDKYIRVYR